MGFRKKVYVADVFVSKDSFNPLAEKIFTRKVWREREVYNYTNTLEDGRTINILRYSKHFNVDEEGIIHGLEEMVRNMPGEYRVKVKILRTTDSPPQ